MTHPLSRLCDGGRALAAASPELPGLAALLDTSAALTFAELSSCTRLRRAHIRLKPNVSALLTLDAEGPGGERRLISLKAMTREHYRIVAARSEESDRHHTPGPNRRMHPELAIAIREIPSDPELRGVGRFLARPDGSQALANLADLSRPPDIEPLAYKAERRLVARISIGERSAGVLRLYARRDWAAIMAATNLARAAGIATPLGRDDRRSTLVVPWQPGEVLIALPTHTWPREIPSVVELLLRLHRSAPDILRPVYRGEVTCLPFDLEPALGTLVAHANKLAAQAAGALKSTDRSLLHGDVSADQIVISNRGPAIIDWDRCHIGPGSIDFGALAASLIFDAGMAPGDSVDCVAAALCDNDAEWLVADLPQATALAAIGRAVEPFRLLYDDWPRAVVDRVTVADLLLQKRSSTSIGKSANSANAPDPIAKLEYLAERAVDRESSAFAAVERVLTEEYGQGKVTEATVVRLKPDRRAIVRYRFILDHGGESEALAKIRVKGLDHRAFEIQFALANAWRQSADGLGCARAIGTVPSAHLWLQSVVDGHDGTAALIGEYESSRFGDWAAALMMKLHRTPLSVRRRWTVDDEADMLTAALANVAEGRRDLSDRIARLAQASRLCLAELGPPPAETVIHRDFYHDQVMVAAEAAFLIDLDLAAIGDPAQDAGNFLAHLDELAIREPAIAENVRAAATAFRERLLDAPDLYSAARVAAFNAISLARLVAVSHRISSRRASTGRLLAAAEQMLSSRATRA